eukprot:145688-Pleurochrysis_carterae.AAC.2
MVAHAVVALLVHDKGNLVLHAAGLDGVVAVRALTQLGEEGLWLPCLPDHFEEREPLDYVTLITPTCVDCVQRANRTTR